MISSQQNGNAYYKLFASGHVKKIFYFILNLHPNYAKKFKDDILSRKKKKQKITKKLPQLEVPFATNI